MIMVMSVCRVSVPESAEASGGLQLAVSARPQSLSAPQRAPGQPCQCAQVVAVCWGCCAQTDPLAGVQLAPV
jgi:hypothetical protein